jgi:hypothetical protein
MQKFCEYSLEDFASSRADEASCYRQSNVICELAVTQFEPPLTLVTSYRWRPIILSRV